MADQRRSVTLTPAMIKEVNKFIKLRNTKKLTPGKFTINSALNEGLMLWIESEKTNNKPARKEAK